jgi:hypothetical protein
MHNRKLYMARFTNKDTGFIFYKIGQCWQYDADERFLYENDQYEEYNIKIMTSAWGPANEVDEWEERFLNIKKKDFWLPGKFSGITEIRQFDTSELNYLFEQFKKLSSKWYDMRHKGLCKK